MIPHRCLSLILITPLFAAVLCQAETGQTTTSYWDAPIPAQSPAPQPPETCGACHADKYSDWKDSRHAHAFSPGLIGQIIDYDEADAAGCLKCHAPLEEQHTQLSQIDIETPASNTEAHQPRPLAHHGVFCATCHLRDGILHAPSTTAIDTETRVHQDIKVEPFMQDSLFCSSCHQFDMAAAINGKPLQNTYREWLDSPYAEQGISCQSCHMPDGAHLFRGIHDPDTVKQGLTISTRATDSSVDLVVQSTGIGHRFPTYSVARVRITATALDKADRAIRDGYRERVLQRLMAVEGGQWIELSDTRLAPGESVTLSVPRRTAGVCAARIVYQVSVDPEWYYHTRVYPSVIEELEAGQARDLLVKAKSESEARHYVLFEKTIRNSCID